MEEGENNKERLEQELEELEETLETLGEQLSKARQAIASKIETAIDAQRHDLQIGRASCRERVVRVGENRVGAGGCNVEEEERAGERERRGI